MKKNVESYIICVDCFSVLCKTKLVSMEDHIKACAYGKNIVFDLTGIKNAELHKFLGRNYYFNVNIDEETVCLLKLKGVYLSKDTYFKKLK